MIQLEFQTSFRSATVSGYSFPDKTPIEVILKYFRNEAYKRTNEIERIEIFGADHFSIPNKNPLAISIQNGVWWDQPIELLTHKKIFYNKFGELIFRIKKQFQMLHLFENCYNRVCADLNFINWYRTCRGGIKGKVWYNPNPAPCIQWDSRREIIKAPNKPVRIIFPRRFIIQKGTRLITSVFKSILKLRLNVQITLAGEGPEKEYLLKEFNKDSRVTVTSYRIDEVGKVLSDHDSVLIPSLLFANTNPHVF